MSFEETAEKLPQFFLDALRDAYSEEDVRRVVEGVADRRTTTLRANNMLSDRSAVESALAGAEIAWNSVPWLADGFIVEGATAKDLSALDIYEQGGLYLQSLSSMIPAVVLDPKAGDEILDMCAAPGGKTTQMASMGGRKCHITACEMNAPRAEKLEFNLAKQGATAVNILRVDARKLDSFFSFDKVLLDAPCSGSGTIWASDFKLAKRFNEGLLAKCRKQQAALLAKALQVVKPGGTLVYSTCSVLKEENERQVEEAIKKMSRRGSCKIVPIEFDGMEHIPTLPSNIDGVLTVCPTKLYEGFFACKILREA